MMTPMGKADDRVTSQRRTLVILLRAVAIMGMAAIVAVVMPHSWMNWFHQKMGLGELPDIPIVGYLTRSLSAFYVWIGALAWFASRDLDRHLPIVRFFAATGAGVGIVLTGIDFAIGIPWWWALSAGLFAIFYFGAIWWLARRAESA